jgi:hypothetical protein
VKKLSVVLVIFFCSCSDHENELNHHSISKTKANKEHVQVPITEKGSQEKMPSAYRFQIIGTSGNFGYQIMDGTGKLIINQPSIPAIQGNKGFSSESDARKAAEFVIQKIDKGVFPPTFSVAELDSLGLTH